MRLHGDTRIASGRRFDKTFDVNVRGVFFTVQKALPLMSRGGAVVLVASNLHLKGYPAHSTYAASKAAVRSFARSWATELLDRAIRVNTLSPGSIDTQLWKAALRPKSRLMKLVITWKNHSFEIEGSLFNQGCGLSVS
ncbi:MAG: SDR family oxidoreductase [Beijerinckiaceae bacterium]|nr:SDR family oxidoreductase [Beijerinckiaceae bacterium]